MVKSESRGLILQVLHFIGRRTARLLAVAVLVGIGWFFVEASFVYVMQIFLVAIGLLDPAKTFLPLSLNITPVLGVTALLAYGFFRSIVNFFRSFLSGVTNQSFVRFQRSMILNSAMRPGSTMSSHEMTSLFNETITNAGLFLMKTSEFTISVTSLCFFVLMGLYLAPRELLISVVALGCVVYPLKVMNRRIYESGKGLQEEYSSVNRTLLVAIKNRFFLEIVGQTGRFLDLGLENLKKYETHYRRFYLSMGLKALMPNFFGISIIAGVTLLSLRYFHTEPVRLLGFFYVFLRLAQGASEASVTLGDFRLHSHAFKRLMKVNLDAKIKAADSQEKKEQLLSGRQIVCENVDFAYSDRSVFQNFNLRLERGDRLLLRGPSGSGKSTLILLLAGILKPSQGRVLIDGKDANLYNLGNFISYAGPEPFLIDGTIRDNLKFGTNAENLSDDILIEHLKRAELWELVQTLPGTLDFALNEQAQFSTGQKQRLALARAILRRSQLIIFDEATSNIDFATEQKIMRNFSSDFQDRIVILITHRDTLTSYATKELALSSTSGGTQESEL